MQVVLRGGEAENLVTGDAVSLGEYASRLTRIVPVSPLMAFTKAMAVSARLLIPIIPDANGEPDTGAPRMATTAPLIPLLLAAMLLTVPPLMEVAVLFMEPTVPLTDVAAPRSRSRWP